MCTGKVAVHIGGLFVATDRDVSGSIAASTTVEEDTTQCGSRPRSGTSASGTIASGPPTRLAATGLPTLKFKVYVWPRASGVVIPCERSVIQTAIVRVSITSLFSRP